MKGKKHKGTKAEIRAYKEKIRRIATAVTVTLLAAIIVVSGFLIYFSLNPPSNQTVGPTQLKAAIVDHLSLTAPNRTFIQSTKSILEAANYTVEYYEGEEVTVNFYKNLPKHGYDIIILRVHSALQSYEEVSPLLLFTSERYSQLDYLLQPPGVEVVAYSTEEVEKGILYYGIKPSFVQNTMNGMFNNSTIIMMGCDGLRYQTMAEAFIQKGAKVYIGWSRGVLASHTDSATANLLEHLITERRTAQMAVTETMNEVGPDPKDNSTLLYYPT